MTRHELAQLVATLGSIAKGLRSGEYAPRHMADVLEQEREKVLKAIQASLDADERRRALGVMR